MEDCPALLLADAALIVTDGVDRALAPLNVRTRDFRLLQLLAKHGPQLQRALGGELGVDRTTVVALVDHLEQLLLAKRCRCEDRRAYMVTITPKGERVFADASARIARNDAKLFAALTKKERNALRGLLKKLLY